MSLQLIPAGQDDLVTGSDPTVRVLKATAASRAPEVKCYLSSLWGRGVQAATFVYFPQTFTLWHDGSPPEIMQKELTPQDSVDVGR